MELRDFSVLVERLYDAALNPEGWRGMAADLAHAFNSGSCKFQFQDLQRTHASVLCATSNYDARSNADYESYYFAKDPCVTEARKIGVGTPILSHEMIAPEIFLNSEVYNDYSRRIGVFYLVGAMLPVGNGAVAGIGIHRPYGSDCYDAADREAMGLLVPHLTRALQMYRKLHGLNGRAPSVWPRWKGWPSVSWWSTPPAGCCSPTPSPNACCRKARHHRQPRPPARWEPSAT